MYTLSDLKQGQTACVAGFSYDTTDIDQSLTIRRLMEMGLIRGCKVTLCHEAPIGKDPIAIKVRGSLIGVRRRDAKNVLVEICKGKTE
ncbi:MAG: FeoA family protein [Bdellovibrionota bacterium]